MLDVRGLQVTYGQIIAVHELNIHVEEGTIVALIGPNGAGKTSTMMAVSGLVPAKTGEIFFLGDEITGRSCHHIYRHGIVQIPEGRLIFQELSVKDNLLLGAGPGANPSQTAEDLENVLNHFPTLRERFKEQADTLSGGQLQMLAIARGLMGRPKLLMLDEPSLGLAPKVVDEVFRMITQLNEKGMTILLVEQNVNKALKICKHAYLMEAGRIVANDTGTSLLNSEHIIKSYLGSTN